MDLVTEQLIDANKKVTQLTAQMIKVKNNALPQFVDCCDTKQHIPHVANNNECTQ